MVQNTIRNSNILITGGTGSFGTTMVRHALKEGAREVRVLSRDEAKQELLRNSIGDTRLKSIIGDTRDYHSVRPALEGVDLVFHAAALKQVPTAEFFPIEAVKTNILGSNNVLSASIEAGVSRVVCLSTDKAVYPINAMGMSKALMEKTAQSFARNLGSSSTVISVTRYGNVMFSRGSVIPLFISQIKKREPLTLTNPDMTRFLMSLQDSVHLVEHAFKHAQSGDLFVKKAPAATIGDLAQALIELFDSDSNLIRVIGTRHGEKLFESLLGDEEGFNCEDQGGFFRVPLDARDMNYSMYFSEGKNTVPKVQSYNSHNAQRLSVDEVKALLLTLPEVRMELSLG